MANKSQISWQHDGKNTDGSAFDATQFGGWDLEVNGAVALSVPIGYTAGSTYTFPFANAPAFSKTGHYKVRLRLVNKNGDASAWSNMVEFDLDFRVPTAPFGLTVS